MSSDGDAGAAAAATATLFNTFYTEEDCNVATAALFFYEAIVTFDREVACFWTAKWNGAALLFVANKWISMTFYVMVLVQLTSSPSDEVKNLGRRVVTLTDQIQSCALFQRVMVAMQILTFVPAAVFSALRAYVLSRSKLLGLFVLVLSLAPVGANLVHYGYDVSGQNFPLFRCLETDSTAAAGIQLSEDMQGLTTLIRTVVISARVPLIIADTLLIYITWTKLSSRDALRDIRQSKRLTLSDILFRDGTVYFVVLFVLNTLHLAFSLAAVADSPSSQGSYLTVFTGPITTVLVSRFLLELQEASRAVIRVDPDNPLHFSRDPYNDTPSFISSIGAFINPDLPAARDEDSELNVGSRSSEENIQEGSPAAQATELQLQAAESQPAAASSSSV